VPTVTDTTRALADPELAVLSAMAHGDSDDTLLAAQIAQAAIAASIGLDPDRSVLYFDMVLASLSEAARNSLQAMDPANYDFQSEFAKRYLAEGEAKGRAEGRAEGRTEGEAKGRTEGEATLLSKLLTLKFGPLDDATAQRLRGASTTELERWAERILTANALDDVFR
jgi:predicted transposase YdaD